MTSGRLHARRGRLYVIAAPSGAGKTSLVRALLDRVPALSFSVSYTTRPRRETEADGRDYFFVDAATFQQMVEAGEFLEHAEVFDNRYGTSKAHVAGLLEAGRSVVLEIDWQGARQIRRAAPEALGIFILPPSVEALERRLRSRGTDSETVIRRRLTDALDDMRHWSEFDFVVVNDDFDEALEALAAIVGGAGGPHSTQSAALRERIGGIAGATGPESA